MNLAFLQLMKPYCLLNDAFSCGISSLQLQVLGEQSHGIPTTRLLLNCFNSLAILDQAITTESPLIITPSSNFANLVQLLVTQDAMEWFYGSFRLPCIPSWDCNILDSHRSWK